MSEAWLVVVPGGWLAWIHSLLRPSSPPLVPLPPLHPRPSPPRPPLLPARPRRRTGLLSFYRRRGPGVEWRGTYSPSLPRAALCLQERVGPAARRSQLQRFLFEIVRNNKGPYLRVAPGGQRRGVSKCGPVELSTKKCVLRKVGDRRYMLLT